MTETLCESGGDSDEERANKKKKHCMKAIDNHLHKVAPRKGPSNCQEMVSFASMFLKNIETATLRPAHGLCV
jgi:hypothetical protein